MKIIDGIAVFGETDEGAMSQARTCAKTAAHVALMADNHKGYAVPIGGVVAYEDSISPSGVGYDIGCGNKAVRLDIPPQAVKLVRDDMAIIMDKVWSEISFGIGQKNNTKVDHALFDDPAWNLNAISGLKQSARAQLGTIGSGNHYVDIFVDELNRVWVGVHFGSRGFGHKTATYFLEAAGAKDGMDVEPCVLPARASIGADYLECMRLAGEYAYAGRDWVCQKVADIIGAPIVEEVHNHHNFAWRERHFGKDLWVVRKGATPAFPGQKGFVGGTMAEPAVILGGVESPERMGNWSLNDLALYSTVHGAGRVMGRKEAAGNARIQTRWTCRNYRQCDYSGFKGDHKRAEDGAYPKCPKCGTRLQTSHVKTQTRAGRVTEAMMAAWVTNAGIELRGAGLDESPDCYKRLPNVLEAQGSTIRVLHTLTPLGVAMAGADEFDPFND